MQGTIKRINDRGFGFVIPDGENAGPSDHFFHAKDLVEVTFDSLRAGQRVMFDSFNEPKGLVAKNVTPVD